MGKMNIHLGGDGFLHNSMNILNLTKLHTFNVGILQHVNYIATKLLQRKCLPEMFSYCCIRY